MKRRRLTRLASQVLVSPALALLAAVPTEAAEEQVNPARESFKTATLGSAATILVDNADLTLALGAKRGYLELQAIIWADGSRRHGKNAEGRRIGDYSAFFLDLDSDGAPTAELDRDYYLNPWPSRRGIFYVTKLGDRSTTRLTREPKAKGGSKYLKGGVNRRTRVDWYRIPLETIPVQGDTLGLCFFASSAVPELQFNSVGYAPATLLHHIPGTLCHRLVLKEGIFFTAAAQGDG